MTRSRIENTPLVIFLTLLAVLTLAPAAHAGIVDSPVPDLDGTGTTKVRFTVPGVINTVLGTYFSCTSTTTLAQDVAVEVFQNMGGSPLNDAVTTKLTVDPGATVVFGTTGAFGVSIDKDLGSPGSLPIVFKGSARILSTSPKLICTVAVIDKQGSPPATSWQLTIVKALKQVGD